MIKIAIIDFRNNRRQRVHDVVSKAEAEVVPVPSADGLPPNQDLILLHVGAEQEEQTPDSIEEVLERFRQRSWILCYSGGEPVEAARTCRAAEVAVFPAPVPMDAPGPDFVRVIQKILRLLPQRSSLPQHCFRATVTGFDALLEAKLDVLSSALAAEDPLPAHLTATKKAFPTAFDKDGKLRAQPRDADSVAAVRRVFFREGV